MGCCSCMNKLPNIINPNSQCQWVTTYSVIVNHSVVVIV